jgi:hypothetical protein
MAGSFLREGQFARACGLRQGGCWPAGSGAWDSVHERGARGDDRGDWARVFAGVAADPDLQAVLIDATVARAHASAAGAPKERRPGSAGARALARRVQCQAAGAGRRARHPGSSKSVPPPLPRRVMGSIFRWCVHRLVVSDVRDTQCGCKAYRADVSRRLFALSQIDRFSFDAEIIFLAARLGYTVKEVPFTLRHIPGSRVRPIRDSLLMLRDLLRIRLNALRGTYGRLRTTERARQAL